MKPDKISTAAWLDRLSLDAPFAAVVWAWVFYLVRDVPVDWPALGIVFFATWITYVADRLQDVMPWKTVPGTPRHHFYSKHKRLFVTLLAVTFPVCLFFGHEVLSERVFDGGLVFLSVILLYIAVLGISLPIKIRVYLKRLTVSALFTGGIVWVVEAWRVPRGQLLAVFLFLAALFNLFLISMWEAPSKQLGLHFRNAALGVSFIALVVYLISLFIYPNLLWLLLPFLGLVGCLKLVERSSSLEERRCGIDIWLAVCGMIFGFWHVFL